MGTTPKNVIETSLYKGKVKIRFFPDSHVYMVNGERKTGVTTFIGIKDKSRALVIWATELYRDFLLEKFPKVSEVDIYEGCNLHAVRKQEAANIGVKIHAWCEQFIRNELSPKEHEMPDMPDEQAVQIGVNGFLDWVKAHKVKFISTERVVYSKKHDYIGTMDIECLIGAKRYLVDLKSSSGLYNTVNMQTAAYAKADEEENGKKYHGRWAIRLPKETEAEYMAKMGKKQKNDIIKGRQARQIEPYVAFEAKELLTDIDEDYEAFLAAKTLFQWDKKTDYYLNKQA